MKKQRIALETGKISTQNIKIFWTEEEYVQLANGIKEHGLVYKKLVECVPTRKCDNIRAKLEREILNMKVKRFEVLGLVGQAIDDHKEKIRKSAIPADIEEWNKEINHIKQEILDSKLSKK